MGARLAVFALASIVLFGGCVGYSRSAKRWAYAGNSVLIAGGGGIIAADQLGGNETRAMTYEPPLSGVFVAGVVLAAAGLAGMVFTATRPTVKTSSR